MILGVESHSGDEGFTEVTQITESLERYSEENEDVMGEADIFFCRDCKENSNVCTQKEIVQPPKILVFNLKRFSNEDSESENEDKDDGVDGFLFNS